jgi:hypothetical protein
MNDRFVLLKINSEYENIILDVFEGLCGPRIVNEKIDDYNVIYHNYDNESDIINLIKSLESDLDTKILCYVSYVVNNEELKKELMIVRSLLKNIVFGHYNFKSLLLDLNPTSNRDEILDFILKDTGITKEFILEFAYSNLNASKAASSLYMHRNTVIYKLDKLMSLKGFDLKSFIDMHILYSLSK